MKLLDPFCVNPHCTALRSSRRAHFLTFCPAVRLSRDPLRDRHVAPSPIYTWHSRTCRPIRPLTENSAHVSVPLRFLFQSIGNVSIWGVCHEVWRLLSLPDKRKCIFFLWMRQLDLQSRPCVLLFYPKVYIWRVFFFISPSFQRSLLICQFTLTMYN